jgi:hypothetical protein
MAKLKWKCPNDTCPPTERAPLEVKSLDDHEVRLVICRSECAKEFPKGEIRTVVTPE